METKLAGALADIQQGKIKSACAKLQSFINQVDALVAAGTLTAPDGQALKDSAAEVMAEIGCT